MTGPAQQGKQIQHSQIAVIGTADFPILQKDGNALVGGKEAHPALAVQGVQQRDGKAEFIGYVGHQ